ncbi:MAG: energy-coupling factor transporter transmembrane protein EcfT [Rhodobacteraceae bacterium]|jgi:biotin transport system permease protein|nr:energy-coupling factor transporter transmembrane protein EcfT [Paracoccaceae bacterium]
MLTLTSPVETALHRLPAGAKMATLCGFTVGLFAMDGLLSLTVALVVVGLAYAPGGRPFMQAGLRALWPLWPFVLVVAAWHALTQAPAAGAVVILRLVAAVAAANLVTMTTPLSAMIALFQWLARPLAPLGLPPRRLALAMALVIRFVPVLLQNAGLLTQAWRARSSRPPRWRLLPPLALSAIDEADRVAEALRARGGAG